ncbi:MAG TPA: efflux RND transporter periplasmic adaptor subunit [Lentisphaeria bacterium]|nr:efflux RND transporter periplasmic adaptor subunit [Lentisphaeria bacterium]
MKININVCRLPLLFLISLFIASCSKKEEVRKAPPVPVTVAKVELKQIPTQIDTYGTIEAYTVVPIKSLVGGQIVNAHVKSGQEVKKGDLLFSIDARPYDATLKQIEANLERDTVLSVDAERQSRVKTGLHEKKAVSEDEMFRTKAVSESLKRAVKVDEANMDRAKLDVEYCSIKSPIDGRAGDVLVDEGNVIKANDQKLIVINQIKPVSVSFSVPQYHLNQLKRHIAEKKLDLQIRAQKEDEPQVKAELEFMDNAVDPNTGTIRMEARLDNENEQFWPGQFVNVTISMLSEKPVLVVPSQAVQPSQNGNYSYVVKPDMAVELRIVTILRSVNGETALSSGIADGETIVTDGHLKLVPGSKVDIKSPDASAGKKTETK